MLPARKEVGDDVSLSARAAQVLGDVLRATTPVRVAEIAARAGVSERTIKTDVNRARTWLENRGFALSPRAHEASG